MDSSAARTTFTRDTSRVRRGKSLVVAPGGITCDLRSRPALLPARGREIAGEDLRRVERRLRRPAVRAGCGGTVPGKPGDAQRSARSSEPHLRRVPCRARVLGLPDIRDAGRVPGRRDRLLLGASRPRRYSVQRDHLLPLHIRADRSASQPIYPGRLVRPRGRRRGGDTGRLDRHRGRRALLRLRSPARLGVPDTAARHVPAGTAIDRRSEPGDPERKE